MSSLLILLVCLLTCGGQLCQKKAAQQWHGLELNWREKLSNGWLLAALLLLGLGLLIWLVVLRLVPLNIAYPMLSLNFVLVTLASHFWFGEHTSIRHWWGIVLIVLGIVLLGAGL